MRAALEALRGGSARIAAIRAQVDQLLGRQARARRVPPILILGETGTGKGLLAHVREAERIARQLGDARRRAIAASWLSAKHWDMGELSEARGWAEVTLALANSLDDEPLRGMGHYNVGRALLAAGQYRRAIESFRSGTDATGDYRAYARAWTCWALAGLGEFAATEAKARRLRAIATPWPSPRRSPCARSPLTVTPAWRAWPSGRAGARTPGNPSRPPPRCTAGWA